MDTTSKHKLLSTCMSDQSFTREPFRRWKHCRGCIDNGGDLLLMLDEPTGDCFLLRLITGSRQSKILLPPLRQPAKSVGAFGVLGSTASFTVEAQARWRGEG
uniref:Uncharacterized protein n=1 Tax=Oryza nivara TaxID=4536 RepID=A0A0E0ICP3_ORYNI